MLSQLRYARVQAVTSAFPGPCALRFLRCQSTKGFGEESKTPVKQASDSGSIEKESTSVEALEAQIRGRRKEKGKIEPQVKVNAPVVDTVTGKAPVTPESQVETAAVLGLFYFFLLILVEGLLLAGSGFLPEGMDLWVQEKVYPGYSPTVVLFLGCSSLYGLYKTGKLPGQKQL